MSNEHVTPAIAGIAFLAVLIFLPASIVDRLTFAFAAVAIVFMVDMIRMLIWWPR